MKTILTIFSLVFFTACAPLSHHDSWIGDTGEVVGRTLLCPVTLCFSELGLYNNLKEKEEQKRYNAWYQSLSPEQQDREDQRVHERGMAAMQALGMMNFGKPLLQYQPPRRAYAPNPTVMPQLPTNIQTQTKQSTTCISRTSPYGGQVTTNCY